MIETTWKELLDALPESKPLLKADRDAAYKRLLEAIGELKQRQPSPRKQSPETQWWLESPPFTPGVPGSSPQPNVKQPAP